jgi:hypothetical protein
MNAAAAMMKNPMPTCFIEMSLVRLRRRMVSILAKENRKSSRVEALLHVERFNMAEARQTWRYR